jgi:hypothetical protein
MEVVIFAVYPTRPTEMKTYYISNMLIVLVKKFWKQTFIYLERNQHEIDLRRFLFFLIHGTLCRNSTKVH